ncbi:MAG: hypothetical protein QNJ62_11740 [Methyloceanibacter sp.]|nr:hypothetical protein [Methyloceanibacter sp.]
MNTSIYLAKLIGPILLVVGAGLLFNKSVYREAAEDVIKSRALLYLFGATEFTAGLAIVLAHNVWAWNWSVIITLLGWLLLVRGAVRIVLPQQIVDFGAKLLRDNSNLLSVSGFVVLVLGAVLSFFGYFA